MLGPTMLQPSPRLAQLAVNLLYAINSRIVGFKGEAMFTSHKSKVHMCVSSIFSFKSIRRS
jgi:hypothetical protein